MNGFFEELQVSPVISSEGDKKLYKSANIELWLADFFDLKVQETNTFECIFDRAALVALPESLRPSYAKHLKSFLSRNGHLLIITMDYDINKMSGPPFYVSKKELCQLFETKKVNELDRMSMLNSHPRWRELELTRLDEVLYEVCLD